MGLKLETGFAMNLNTEERTVWDKERSLSPATFKTVLLTVPGAPGLTGLHVPRAVVEELRPGGDCVTVQPRHTVVQTVTGRDLRRDNVTLSHVLSQVKTSQSSYINILQPTPIYYFETEFFFKSGVEPE